MKNVTIKTQSKQDDLLKSSLSAFGLNEKDLDKLTPLQRTHVVTHMRQMQASQQAGLMRQQAQQFQQAQQKRTLQDTSSTTSKKVKLQPKTSE